MKRVGGILLVIVGGALFLLGLLFVVGAGGKEVRYLIGGVGLAAGAAGLGLGIRMFKSAEAWSPDQILAEILDLARQRNGEISEAEVYARLGRRAERAPPVLGKLVNARLCQRNAKDGSTWYVFKDLQPRLFVKRCGGEYRMDE